MNVNNIVELLQTESNTVSSRRNLFKSMSAKIAAITLPALALQANAEAQTGSGVQTVYQSLDFALQLEYFLYNFYHISINVGSLIPAADKPGFTMIANEQRAHLNLLRLLISNMGGTLFTPFNYPNDPRTGDPYSPPSYDFTANGAYSVYVSYPTFLAVAQAFSDMSTRVYLGLIPSLLANSNNVMTQMITISTIEARHAAYIRQIRRMLVSPENPKPWITNNIPSLVALQPFYKGEDNTSQRGIELTALQGINKAITKELASEAFDEPMDMATAKTLMAPFILK